MPLTQGRVWKKQTRSATLEWDKKQTADCGGRTFASLENTGMHQEQNADTGRATWAGTQPRHPQDTSDGATQCGKDRAKPAPREGHCADPREAIPGSCCADGKETSVITSPFHRHHPTN